MDRYVFFNSSGDARALSAAKKTVRALGATVLGAAAGSLLVEAGPVQAAEVAKALKGWRCAVERKTVQLPERTPLRRARALAGKPWRNGV